MANFIAFIVLLMVVISTSSRRLSSSKLKPSAAIGYKEEKGGPILPLNTKDNTVIHSNDVDDNDDDDIDDHNKFPDILLDRYTSGFDAEDTDDEEILNQLSETRRPHKADDLDSIQTNDLDNNQGQSLSLYQSQQELVGMVVSLTERVEALQHTLTNIKLQNHYIYKTVKRNYKTCQDSANDNLIQTASQKIEKPSCPAAYMQNPNTNTCYKFLPERVSWRMARERCRMDDSDLVSIETKGEQRWITQQARQNPDTRHCDFWTGGSDKKSEGIWRWAANNNPFGYSNWNHNEPNNGRGGEHCMQMLWVFNWAWNDAHCDYHNACYICEVPLGE